jgi:hypothetical protein
LSSNGPEGEHKRSVEVADERCRDAYRGLLVRREELDELSDALLAGALVRSVLTADPVLDEQRARAAVRGRTRAHDELLALQVRSSSYVGDDLWRPWARTFLEGSDERPLAATQC